MTDSVTIKSTPDTAAQEAHEAAMVAKVEGTTTTTAETSTTTATEAPAAERPAWLPETFNTVEEFTAATGLVPKQGEAPKGLTDKEAEEYGGDPKAKTEDTPKGDAEEVLESKGLSLDEFSNEFAEKGELTTESYEKLAKAGIPKAMVDAYIEGQKALAANYEADVKSAAGGEEQFAEVTAWAIASLTDAEKIAYNKAIDSGNVEQAKLAVAGLKAKFVAANPTEGNLLAGRFANAVGDRYESTAQMTADMRDPRYNKDPAFRQKVQDKIARSDVI